VLLAPADNMRLVELCGPLDEHLHLIESRLSVEVRRRGNRFQLVGSPAAIDRAEIVLQGLYARSQREPVDSERVHIALQELDMNAAGAQGTSSGADELKVRTARGAIRARGTNQTEYLNHVRTHDLTFGIGPAGTGKTYLAVACAVEALQSEKVRRIVLVRPAVEAGERLGFLPCRRKSIRICVPCTTPCMRCSGSNASRNSSSATSSRLRRWPSCAAAR
jgi:phosphate starvation-inducible PhoH-like protein